MSEYWEQRYAAGKTSGLQSHREWEHSIIDPYLTKLSTVLDVGCGDLAFWQDYKLPFLYTGIDISPTIITKNRKQHPDMTFICGDINTLELQKYDIVLCLNVIYHLMQDDIQPLIQKIYDAGTYHIFLTNWSSEPLTYDDRYQRHHTIAIPYNAFEIYTYFNTVMYHIDKEQAQ